MIGTSLQRKFPAAQRSRAFSGSKIAIRRALLWSVGTLLLLFFVGQSLGVVHTYSHVRSQASTHCGICLVGTQDAAPAASLPGLTPPVAIGLRVVVEPGPAASRLFQQTAPARAPPA